jgi:colanic acid/amylovoran biosynthesis glycosyltransferase
MAGRFVEKKGFALGLEAFGALGRDDAELTIMGEGREGPRLHADVERLGLVDRVRFVPFGNRAAYRAELARADIILQPSVTARSGDSEGGAPVVLLDAQAIGLVVVASDHADIPFVVDSEAAFLSPEGDAVGLARALREAIEVRDEWRDRSLRGRQHVERQHGFVSVARARDEIYADAIRR